ncbi:MAG: signal peptidase II [Myxococcaceae bacterium]|nr:signal peptidase II [Myxococcaceae bacterium]
MSTSRKTIVLFAVASFAFVADQGTKHLAVAHLTTALEGREGIGDRFVGFLTETNLEGRRARGDAVVIDGYWDHRYVQNPGAAWGLFSSLPEQIRTGFFLAITLVAIVAIVWMYRRLDVDRWWMQSALALVLGGAVGNFVDRALRGYVIDFIDWHWRNVPGMHWPTFNVADAAISIGVAMMLLDAAFGRRKRNRAKEPAAVPLEDALRA